MHLAVNYSVENVERWGGALDLTGGAHSNAIHVRDVLSNAGVTGDIEHIYFTYFRKALVWIRDESRTRRVIKIALSGYACELLRRESEGYAAIKQFAGDFLEVPNFQIVYDTTGCCIAQMEEIRGKAYKPWTFPKRTIGGMVGINGYRQLGELIESLLAGADTLKKRESLIRVVREAQEKYGKILLPLSPSHGDFVHWNVLALEKGRKCFLDLEYYSAHRPMLHDDWHWFVSSIVRRGINYNRSPLFGMPVKWLPKILWIFV